MDGFKICMFSHYSLSIIQVCFFFLAFLKAKLGFETNTRVEEKKMGVFGISPLALLSHTQMSSHAKQTTKPILSPKCMDDKGMKFAVLGGYLNF